MRVNIHIRKENELIWEQIPNKSEWVNNQLKGDSVGTPSAENSKIGSPAANFKNLEIKTASELETPKRLTREERFQQFLEDYKDRTIVRPPHPEFGYPCCHSKNRCKHWEFDSINTEYKNQLTLEIIDASF